MKHKFCYRTNLGGWVCMCSRYFDSEKDLNRHIKEENFKLKI